MLTGSGDVPRPTIYQAKTMSTRDTVTAQLRDAAREALANALDFMTSGDIASITQHITTEPNRVAMMLNDTMKSQIIPLARVRISDGQFKWGYYDPNRLNSRGQVHHPLGEKMASVVSQLALARKEAEPVAEPALPVNSVNPEQTWAFDPVAFQQTEVPAPAVVPTPEQPAEPVPQSANITLPVTAKSITLTIAGVAIKIDFA